MTYVACIYFSMETEVDDDIHVLRQKVGLSGAIVATRGRATPQANRQQCSKYPTGDLECNKPNNSAY